MTRSLYSSFFVLSAATAVLSTPLATSHQYVPPRRSSSFPIAPLYVPSSTINNSYIVMLKDDLSAHAIDSHFNFLAAAHEADPFLGDASGIKHVYDTTIKGYAGMFTDNVVEQIRTMPEVAFVERDSIVTIYGKDQKFVTQKSAPWGLARISHREALRLSTFNKYEYVESGGEGVDVYVIDTGINIDHVDFEGRAKWGKTIPQNDYDIDGNGHGSHCAGTIGGKTYGVAKKANIIAVKVLGTNGSGSMSDVIAGVDWAANAAKAKAKAAAAELAATGKTKHKGSVANMSLGGGKSPALDKAVNDAVKKSGIHFAVAAGNDNKDACNYSPAAAELAITVGASTIQDERAYFSNWGKCVDVFAPGLNIKSTYKGSNNSVEVLSGTSMASPHVAGLVAYYLSLYPSVTFDPDLNAFVPAAVPQSQETLSTTSSIYAIAHSALPSFISSFLPSPKFFEVVVAPVPPRTITTDQLKAAVIAIASEGILSDLPAGTVNKLIFNNATA